MEQFLISVVVPLVIVPWVLASAERALDLSRRASELAGMAFEIAFEKAGRVSVPSEKTLEPTGRALKPSRGGLGASWEAGEGQGETKKERKSRSVSPYVLVP